MSEEIIRNFSGQILGRLEDQGDKIVARDFYGKIISNGNTLAWLIAQAAVENGYSVD